VPEEAFSSVQALEEAKDFLGVDKDKQRVNHFF